MQHHELESLAQQYRHARDQLAEAVNELELAVQHLRAKRLPIIKDRVATAIGIKDALREAGEANPALFEKPRTRTLHGIRLGYKKGRGQISWADGNKVVSLIRRYFPEQADTLIRVTESPVKPALNNLSTGDLRRIGVTVIEAGDEVFIKPVDGEVDKLVDALLKDDEAVAA